MCDTCFISRDAKLLKLCSINIIDINMLSNALYVVRALSRYGIISMMM